MVTLRFSETFSTPASLHGVTTLRRCERWVSCLLQTDFRFSGTHTALGRGSF